MSVLMINGSPHPKGCTFTALNEVATQLKKHGIESEFIHIGTGPIAGCISCGKCGETGYCVFKDDGVNAAIDKLKAAEGLVVGSPVYYAAPNGALCAFLDRLFFMKSDAYAFKPAACVVNCRRGGASAAFERLNKYFTISRMPVVSSQYWNSTHGFTPDDVRKDLEGLQTMRTLGDNMAWLIRCIAAGKAAGIEPPAPEPWIPTHFLR
ncbi:MAG: flavodoxin family protein [Deltaproteobacteria bacterium]|nr:flavodoxin family protein [Deltaproteobacteria bacterium]